MNYSISMSKNLYITTLNLSKFGNDRKTVYDFEQATSDICGYDVCSYAYIMQKFIVCALI